MTSVSADIPNEPYTIRTCKGTALVPETRILLQHWKPGMSAGELASQVLEQDLLGKSTARRVKDLVQRVFGPRYLSPETCPAKHLKTLVEQHPAGDWFRDLCLLYTARADSLARDAVTALYRRVRNEGRLTLSVETAIGFLREAEEEGKMSAPWSSETKRKVARGLLKMLAEFGFLVPRTRGSREIRNFRPHPLAIAYLAFELHFSGITDARLVEHPDWRIWLMDNATLRDALDDLSRHGLWIFQAAGAVVRITWNLTSMEEAVNVLAGLDL